MKWAFPKALAIMTLAGFGIGMIFGGMHTYGGEGEIGFGAFLLLGAGFLYRGWFGRGYSPRPKPWRYARENAKASPGRSPFGLIAD